MLAAGFCDPSSQALRNFHCFRNASALRHQPWNVRTCAQVAAVVKVLYADTNGHFLNFCQMFLPSHRHHPLRRASINSTMLPRTISVVSYADNLCARSWPLTSSAGRIAGAVTPPSNSPPARHPGKKALPGAPGRDCPDRLPAICWFVETFASGEISRWISAASCSNRLHFFEPFSAMASSRSVTC